MSLDHEDAVGIERALWPDELDPYGEDARQNQPPKECAVLWLREGQILFRCEDPYYVGGLTKEATKQLLCMCATALAGEKASLFETTGDTYLTVRQNGSVGVLVGDDHYSGELQDEDAFRMALEILRDKT